MFYKDCYYCNENSVEKCFKCSEARIMQEDWIYSLGFYYPRCLKEHEKRRKIYIDGTLSLISHILEEKEI